MDTALLGELVAHPDFMKLLADVSIYVNGVAAMQIHNLNAWVEAVRAKIVDEYQPGEQDMDALLSDAILLRERDYFTGRVHEDIDAIMEDIREAHRGRNESGAEHSAIADLKQDLEDVANFKGSRAEAWLMMYCKQTQTPYNKLSEEEKHWLMRIAQNPSWRKAMFHREGRKRNELKRIANGLSHLGTPSCIGSFIFAYSVWQMSMKATTSHLRRYPHFQFHKNLGEFQTKYPQQFGHTAVNRLGFLLAKNAELSSP